MNDKLKLPHLAATETATETISDSYAPGTTLAGLRTIVTASSQGSRNGNLGLEGGTALRLWRQSALRTFNWHSGAETHYQSTRHNRVAVDFPPRKSDLSTFNCRTESLTMVNQKLSFIAN